jgi:hypothetical protein
MLMQVAFLCAGSHLQLSEVWFRLLLSLVGSLILFLHHKLLPLLVMVYLVEILLQDWGRLRRGNCGLCCCCCLGGALLWNEWWVLCR